MITVFFILMCKKVDKCFDKPRKDVSLHSKLLREHTFILILAMKKNVYFFARTSVDRVERLRQ